ncbi:MAG: porin [Halioglobus sp.]
MVCYRFMLLGALTLCLASPLRAEGEWEYGSKGWEWSNSESGSYLWAGLRMQTRYSNRVDDPLESDDLRQDGEEGVRVNRARYKIGIGFRDDATFYHEYDLRNGNLLDLRATWTPASWFNLRAGQWKSEYNRERIDSSGKQQFVDRSISNYWFTADRQNGVMASGRLFAEQAADSSWWLGVLNGNGLNTGGDGGRPMVVGRWQWNFLRQVLPFSQSALKRYDPARGSLTTGFLMNDSAYTRFSSSGGGQLPGYEDGQDNQYRLQQTMLEYVWQQHGWSLQSEAHYKHIEDRLNGGTKSLWGGYVQGGWFPVMHYQDWPEQLEFAARFSRVVPDHRFDADENDEFTLGANWFFNGHRNKVTMDVSYLEFDDINGQEDDVRIRLQWDISI